MEHSSVLECAKRRFPDQCIGGTGRWALYTPAAGRFGKVLLFESRDEAQRHILDPKRVQVIDLLEPPVPVQRISGDFYDPEELRRERRENRG